MMWLPETEPDDQFYQVSDRELMDGDHGSVVRSKTLVGPAALEHAASSTLVIYRTLRVDPPNSDKPTPVSGIVALPSGKPPVGGWPVVNWAHGTLGSADKGAPSMDSDDLADINDPADPPLTVHRKINRAPHALLNRCLKEGWAVVMTDYEGLGTKGPHPYLNGEAEARDVLDMMRAARELLNVGGSVVLSNRFVIIGHSQGGHAALFAASRAATWTPELKLEGVAAIAPASRLARLPGLAIGPPADRPFLALSLLGALRGDPTIDLNSIFTADGLKLFEETIDAQCRVELSEPTSWARPFLVAFKLIPPQGSLLPEWQLPGSKFVQQLAAMDPMNAALTINVPIRLSQADKDQRVDVAGTRSLFQALKDANRSVCYEEYDEEDNPVATPDPAKLGSHFGILITDIEPLVQWLKQIFKQLSISTENVA